VIGLSDDATGDVVGHLQMWHDQYEELSFSGDHQLKVGDTIKFVPFVHKSCNGFDYDEYGGVLKEHGSDGWAATRVVTVRLPADCEDGFCLYALCIKEGDGEFQLMSHITATVNFKPPSAPPPPLPPPPPYSPGFHQIAWLATVAFFTQEHLLMMTLGSISFLYLTFYGIYFLWGLCKPSASASVATGYTELVEEGKANVAMKKESPLIQLGADKELEAKIKQRASEIASSPTPSPTRNRTSFYSGPKSAVYKPTDCAIL